MEETNCSCGGPLPCHADFEAKRPVSNVYQIRTYFQCLSCLSILPRDTSPREFMALEVGFTEVGLQVWCKRCELNVVHIDFEGTIHPANRTRLPSRMVGHEQL